MSTGRETINADLVLDTAARMLEINGVHGFSMRGLADALEVAVTSSPLP